MKIVETINGITKTTTYGNKVFYQDEAMTQPIQIRNVYYTDLSVSPVITNRQVYLYDNAAPSISITSSSGSTVYTAYTLTGRVTDAHSGVKRVVVNRNGSSSEISIDSNGYFSKYYSSLSSGSHTFTVTAEDYAGNTSSASRSITIYNDKNNSYEQWSTVGWDKPDQKNSYYRISKGGTYYNVIYKAYRQANDNDKKPAAQTGNKTFTIPLPKGLRHVIVGASGYGAGGHNSEMFAGFQGSIELYNSTKGTSLSYASFKWERNNGKEPSGQTTLGRIDVDISPSDSMNDLQIIIKGSARGQQSDWAWSWIGLSYTHTGVNSPDITWSFTYYD